MNVVSIKIPLLSFFFLSLAIAPVCATPQQNNESRIGMFLGIGAAITSIAAAVGGYLYWQHTKKITAANARMERAIKNEELTQDQMNAEVAMALQEGACPNTPLSALTEFHVEDVVPPLAFVIKHGYDKTVKTLLEAKANTTKYNAQSIVRAALFNDAMQGLRKEQESRIFPKPVYYQDRITEMNDRLSGNLHAMAPTLVWYAALKLQECPNGYRSRVFQMILNHTPPTYYVITNLRRHLDDSMRTVGVSDLNKDLVEILATAERAHVSHPAQICTSRNFAEYE